VRMPAPPTTRRGLLPLLLVPLTLLAGCGPELDEAIQEPEIISVDSPFRYPIDMWDDGVEGETLVMVRVTETGRVDSVYVLESSGQAAFDSAAVHGARDLRFTPGRRDERRVAMWAKVPVRFHLSDAEPQAGAMP
jgi:periplasmic protein TonB